MAARTVWHKTKYPGIRYREHDKRKHGIGKDRYYTITYKLDGKTKTEVIGWASEGATPSAAADLLRELKQNQRSGSGPRTLKERKELALLEKEHEAAQAVEKAEKSRSLSYVWKHYYYPQAQKSKGKTSWKREESLFRIWIAPLLGDHVFARIGVRELELLKNHMAEKGKSPSTVVYALAVIRQMFSVMISYELYSGDNPVHRVKKPKKDNMRTRFLTPNEADRLLEHTQERNPKLYLMILMSLYTGLRAGEILKLTWDDVNFAQSSIFVRDTKSNRNRHAPMTSRLCNELELYKKTLPNEQHLVFAAGDGGQMNEVSRVFNKVVVDLGLNDGVEDSRLKVVFHSLRHTYASWLVQRGTPLYTVAKLMGHSTLAMTERYAHLTPDGLRSAISVLEE